MSQAPAKSAGMTALKSEKYNHMHIPRDIWPCMLYATTDGKALMIVELLLTINNTSTERWMSRNHIVCDDMVQKHFYSWWASSQQWSATYGSYLNDIDSALGFQANVSSVKFHVQCWELYCGRFVVYCFDSNVWRVCSEFVWFVFSYFPGFRNGTGTNLCLSMSKIHNGLRVAFSFKHATPFHYHQALLLTSVEHMQWKIKGSK